MKLCLWIILAVNCVRHGWQICTHGSPNNVVFGPSILDRISLIRQNTTCNDLCEFLVGGGQCWDEAQETCIVPNIQTYEIYSRTRSFKVTEVETKNAISCERLCALTPGCRFWNYANGRHHFRNGICSVIENHRHVIHCRRSRLMCTCGVNARRVAESDQSESLEIPVFMRDYYSDNFN